MKKTEVDTRELNWDDVYLSHLILDSKGFEMIL